MIDYVALITDPIFMESHEKQEKPASLLLRKTQRKPDPDLKKSKNDNSIAE